MDANEQDILSNFIQCYSKVVVFVDFVLSKIYNIILD